MPRPSRPAMAYAPALVVHKYMVEPAHFSLRRAAARAAHVSTSTSTGGSALGSSVPPAEATAAAKASLIWAGDSIGTSTRRNTGLWSEGRDDSGAYRIPIGVQFLWAMILGVGLAVLPESPRYLIKKGRISEAKRALARVRGQPLDSECVQDEIAELVASREYELYLIPRTSYIGSWLLCFKGPIRNGSSPIRRTILGMSIQMMQQLTGINFIFYFGVTFFQQLGSVDNPFLIALIFTLVNVCSTPISFFTIDRFGRRPLLIYGAIGMIEE
ncbi:Major facilitator-type transporter ecdD like protein [Verticillium longisporum]|nr:Major facilitator-type transporter ecdD like protein [Verticillium longisporum]